MCHSVSFTGGLSSAFVCRVFVVISVFRFAVVLAAHKRHLEHSGRGNRSIALTLPASSITTRSSSVWKTPPAAPSTTTVHHLSTHTTLCSRESCGSSVLSTSMVSESQSNFGSLTTSDASIGSSQFPSTLVTSPWPYLQSSFAFTSSAIPMDTVTTASENVPSKSSGPSSAWTATAVLSSRKPLPTKPKVSVLEESTVEGSSDQSVNLSELSNKTKRPDSWYIDFSQPPQVQVTFAVLYATVMVTAVLGNLLVCYTVCMNRRMHTVVNYYIVNLAACDAVIGGFVLPSKVLELLAPSSLSPLNNLMCSVMFFLQSVVMFASVLTLVATCFERYFAIVHPLQSRMQQSKRRTYRILVAVWFMSVLGALPNFFSKAIAQEVQLFSHMGTLKRTSCFIRFDPMFRLIYFTVLFIIFYLVPLVLIVFTSMCICRSLTNTSMLHRQGSLLRQEVNRRKVGKMFLWVMACYSISWTPYFAVTMMTQYMKENYLNKHNYYFTMLSINLFAFVHSSINPVIYATMSTRFRKGFVHILRWSVVCCLGRPLTTTDTMGGVGATGGAHSSYADPASSSRGSIANSVHHNGTFKRYSQSH